MTKKGEEMSNDTALLSTGCPTKLTIFTQYSSKQPNNITTDLTHTPIMQTSHRRSN